MMLIDERPPSVRVDEAAPKCQTEEITRAKESQ